MKSIFEAFEVPVGYSDHTLGTTVPVAAVALGAKVIEKHFTIDKTLVGPDHIASLNPKELKTMVNQIRELELALGSSIKSPAESEIKNTRIARKSIVASRDIEKGEIFSLSNLTVKRPANGISPINIWNFIGKTSSRKYKKDDMLENHD
jgi:sialic acid synthase SpsE